MSEEARYILAKKIARGGMAEIFLGKHVGEDGFQRLCAIKRILPHYAQDQEFIQMFRDEAHICKRLQHANIVRVEGFEEVEDSYAIIMEFVDGVDLRTLLHTIEQAGGPDGKQKKRMPLPMACFIIAETSRGLHFAHTKVDEITQQPLGIVHRDISPQNILVSYEGEVKVTDFGIADAENKLTETRPGIVKGKYSYMSPEQISAKGVDARTDVFALSIVLWEMLTMRRLFQGDNEVDTIQRVKNCRIDHELRELNREVDEELDAIVKKGLARDPRKRYRSAGDFEKDLRRYMSRKHPDFTPEDLGSFLKSLMEGRRAESAADIKKTLTETQQKPGRKPVGRRRGMGNIEVSFENDQASGAPPLSVLGRSTPHPHGQTYSSFSGSANRPASGWAHAAHQPLASSSTARAGHTRATGHALAAAQRPRRQHKLYMLAAVAASAMCLALVFAKSFPAQSKPATLTLVTQPARVKVAVNNKALNRGRYVLASNIPQLKPLRLPLIPGRHIVTITRPGYHPYKYDFIAESGESYVKDDIVLKEKSALAAIKVSLKSNDRAVKFDINQGYFVGVLTPRKRLLQATPDVFAGHTYTMRVTSSVAGEKPFTCRFTPRSTSWRQPDELVIDRKARRCMFTGGGKS